MNKTIKDALTNFNSRDAFYGFDLTIKLIKYTQQKDDEELLFKILMNSDLRVEDIKDEYKDLARVILKHKRAKNEGK